MTTTLADLSIDGRGHYGIGAPAVPFSEDLYTYLRITDINDDGTLDVSDLKSVDDERAGEYLLRPNDIVFARTGADTGRSYFYDGTDGSFVYAGFLVRFSLDPKKVNPQYVKYYCQTAEYKEWVASFKAGYTRGNINAKTFAKMPIPLIERKKQDVLVDVLSSLDNKIKLNNEINRNLAQQAQAIYNEMFVQTSNPEWQQGSLSDLVTVRYGKSHKKLADEPYPVYGSGGIIRRVERPLYDKESVLIPRKGSLNNVVYVSDPFWAGDTMFYAEMKRPNVAKFVYYFVKSRDLSSMNAGSAVPSMTKDILNSLELVIPSDKALETFESIVAPMYATMHHNGQESAKLAELRDSLLPHLMSGELEIVNSLTQSRGVISVK